jgi:hypothetical protein
MTGPRSFRQSSSIQQAPECCHSLSAQLQNLFLKRWRCSEHYSTQTRHVGTISLRAATHLLWIHSGGVQGSSGRRPLAGHTQSLPSQLKPRHPHSQDPDRRGNWLSCYPQQDVGHLSNPGKRYRSCIHHSVSRLILAAAVCSATCNAMLCGDLSRRVAEWLSLTLVDRGWKSPVPLDSEAPRYAAPWPFNRTTRSNVEAGTDQS